MEVAQVIGESRPNGGRHANERLRRRGLIPGVIYGHKEAPETIALSKHDLINALRKQTHVVDLKIGSDEKRYLIKEVQYDHLQADPMHVDLMRVDPNEKITVKVPLEMVGVPKGTLDGGEMVTVISDLEVLCGLLDIPDAIRVRVEGLAIGQSIHVRDLELPPNVIAKHGADDTVVLVRVRRGMTEEAVAPVAAEGATAEPEVIRRQKAEEAEAE